MEIYFDEKGEGIEKPDSIVPAWRISGYALIESDKKILTVRGFWSDKVELPGGGIEFGESIREGIRRECYEETGYRVEIGDEVIQIGETNFYCTELGRYFKSVAMVYPGSLVSKRQDAEVINTVEKNEIVKVAWMAPEELKEVDAHPIAWPAINKFLLRA